MNNNVELLIPLDEPGARAIVAANRCLENAARGDRHLLVVLEEVPSQETVRFLIDAFKLDPYFGFAIPRRSDPVSGEILKLHENLGDLAISSLPRRILEEIPPRYILPEFASACFLVRNSVLSNFDGLDETYETVQGAFLHYLWRARRCGFRCVVVNRAIVPAASVTQPRSAAVADANRLHREHPDFGLARREFAEHSLHTHESLLARALSSSESLRQSLLIDARDLPTKINGTVEAFFGICDSLARLKHGWNITILVSPDRAVHYSLSARFPKWKLINELGTNYFTAALRPSQPWSIGAMIDLHGAALFNFYTILDNISWDILYVAPPGLEATWDFLATYTDGIFYISQFTRDRFAARFPAARNTPGHVSYLSLNPADYNSVPSDGAPEDFFLVIGNTLDHKNIAPTVDLLHSKFPSHRMKALGLDDRASHFVETLSSGQIPQVEMDRLFGQARLIVFPSFYEGFGFPVLKALSLGRTILARRSELLFEIAARYRGPGRLIAYGSRSELIDVIQRLIDGLEVEYVELGSAVPDGEDPPGWNEIAAGMLAFIEQQVKYVRTSRWLARQSAIQQLDAYAYERLPGGRPY